MLEDGTALGAARSRKPDGIPLFIDLAVFDDESVNERTQRVGGKVEGIMPIAEAVDENLLQQVSPRFLAFPYDLYWRE